MFKLLQLFSPSILGIRMIDAAEAFETPPLSKTARRYAAMAFCSLLAAAGLLLTAALVDTIPGARPLCEALGWAGLLCLILCVYCGLRYKDANRSTIEQILAEDSRRMDDVRGPGNSPS